MKHISLKIALTFVATEATQRLAFLAGGQVLSFGALCWAAVTHFFWANRFSISFEVFVIDKPASAVQRKAEGSILPTSSMA